MNLFHWLHHTTIQCGSLAVGDTRFDQRSNRDLATILGCRLKGKYWNI